MEERKTEREKAFEYKTRYSSHLGYAFHRFTLPKINVQSLTSWNDDLHHTHRHTSLVRRGDKTDQKHWRGLSPKAFVWRLPTFSTGSSLLLLRHSWATFNRRKVRQCHFNKDALFCLQMQAQLTFIVREASFYSWSTRSFSCSARAHIRFCFARNNVRTLFFFSVLLRLCFLSPPLVHCSQSDDVFVKRVYSPLIFQKVRHVFWVFAVSSSLKFSLCPRCLRTSLGTWNFHITTQKIKDGIFFSTASHHSHLQRIKTSMHCDQNMVSSNNWISNVSEN